MNRETAIPSPPLSGDDQKRCRVLEGALKVFLAYGFGRTTMDDIARSAGLSRPALYLLFRNKTDIYRGLARVVLADVMVKVREALAGEGTLRERLDGMVRFAFFETLKDIEDAPHGPELLDIKNTLAGDIFAQWREEIGVLIAQAIAEHAASHGVDLSDRELSPKALADVFMDSLEGMKVRSDDPRRHLEFALTSVRVLVAALRP